MNRGTAADRIRGHSNVLKRLLIQAGAFNLGMLLRKQVGAGTPRTQVLRAMLLVFGSLTTKQLIGRLWEPSWENSGFVHSSSTGIHSRSNLASDHGLLALIREAIEFHIEGLRERGIHGEEVPSPSPTPRLRFRLPETGSRTPKFSP